MCAQVTFTTPLLLKFKVRVSSACWDGRVLLCGQYVQCRLKMHTDRIEFSKYYEQNQQCSSTSTLFCYLSVHLDGSGYVQYENGNVLEGHDIYHLDPCTFICRTWSLHGLCNDGNHYFRRTAAGERTMNSPLSFILLKTYWSNMKLLNTVPRSFLL